MRHITILLFIWKSAACCNINIWTTMIFTKQAKYICHFHKNAVNNNSRSNSIHFKQIMSLWKFITLHYYYNCYSTYKVYNICGEEICNVINFSHCSALICRDGQRDVLSFVFRLLQANLAIGLNHSAPVTVEQCVCVCVCVCVIGGMSILILTPLK